MKNVVSVRVIKKATQVEKVDRNHYIVHVGGNVLTFTRHMTDWEVRMSVRFNRASAVYNEKLTQQYQQVWAAIEERYRKLLDDEVQSDIERMYKFAKENQMGEPA